MENTFEDVEWLNKVFAGRTLERVEAGNTPGWVLFHFGKLDEADIFITAYCGGNKASCEDDRYWSTVAAHCRYSDGWASVSAIRDPRDPDFPMAFPVPSHMREK